MSPTYDVVVAGSGNAALCAALAAREAGASVLIVEKAPESQRGGNSFFTAGGVRFAPPGLEGLPRGILPAISRGEARAIVGPPPPENPVPAQPIPGAAGGRGWRGGGRAGENCRPAGCPGLGGAAGETRKAPRSVWARRGPAPGRGPPATTRARASAWRWTSGRRRMATGPPVMPSSG